MKGISAISPYYRPHADEFQLLTVGVVHEVHVEHADEAIGEVLDFGARVAERFAGVETANG
jgi:hypothetical protein